MIASKQVLEKRRKQTDDDDHDLQVLQPAWKKKKKEQMWARRILDTNFVHLLHPKSARILQQHIFRYKMKLMPS